MDKILSRIMNSDDWPSIQMPENLELLRQYRTNELVRRRMNFSSDAMADFEGLLEVNRKICKQQMAEKASPTLPTNCAVLP